MTLSSLPFDIIFQIFSDLEPPDVLSLARTNKSLRSFLMHSSSTPVWRAARSRMENLPPYAHDLSEPEFAHLVFDDYCDAPEGGSADWKLRARYCKTCKETWQASSPPYVGNFLIFPAASSRLTNLRVPRKKIDTSANA
ncbi:hypothetical protein PLICRDRAFT_163981 [Plicaturopsis crispa FD-325 SS-3]|nr:hypothetical protein PLICRDRAFT_163981 [Plicaturopsis crispa FD-325 SS-3]